MSNPGTSKSARTLVITNRFQGLIIYTNHFWGKIVLCMRTSSQYIFFILTAFANHFPTLKPTWAQNFYIESFIPSFHWSLLYKNSTNGTHVIALNFSGAKLNVKPSWGNDFQDS